MPPGTTVAVEIQLSALSRDVITRTSAYCQQRIAVLWLPVWTTELEEARYVPRDFERFLHRMYFGKLFYWYDALASQPVSFAPSFLAPDWFGRERLSRRFVTPQPRETLVHLTDLVPA